MHVRCNLGILIGKRCCNPCELSSIDGVCHSHASWVHITFSFGLRAVYPALKRFRPCLCSFCQCMPIISNWGTSIQTAYRPMHGWRWTLAFWSLSWPVTSSLSDLMYWGQTRLVIWSVSSLLARYWFFPKLLLGYSFALLLCSQFGEASVKRCFASLFQTAIISMLQVRLGKPTAIFLVLLQSHCCAWFLGNTSLKLVVITEMDQAINQVGSIHYTTNLISCWGSGIVECAFENSLPSYF